MVLSWMTKILDLDGRTEERRQLAGITAHYCDGSRMLACDVRNINMGGAYLLTDVQWYAGTVLKITLHFIHHHGESRPPAIAESASLCVLAQAVRSGTDGVGVRFVFMGKREAELKKNYPDCATDRQALRRFLKEVEQNSEDSGRLSQSFDITPKPGDCLCDEAELNLQEEQRP